MLDVLRFGLSRPYNRRKRRGPRQLVLSGSGVPEDNPADTLAGVLTKTRPGSTLALTDGCWNLAGRTSRSCDGLSLPLSGPPQNQIVTRLRRPCTTATGQIRSPTARNPHRPFKMQTRMWVAQPATSTAVNPMVRALSHRPATD
jgi:hypothetical protein